LGDRDHKGDELKGMARSIGNLFDSFDDMEPTPEATVEATVEPKAAPVPEAEAEDMPLLPKVDAEVEPEPVLESEPVTEPEPEPEPEPESALEPEPEEDTGPPTDPLAVALDQAVSSFLLGTSSQRRALAEVVRSAFEEARTANLLDALAEAVDALLVQPVPDPAGEELGRSLMNAAVESRMAIRLGAVREERRRADLIQVYAGMGDSMADAIAEALSATDDRLARRTYVALLVEMGAAGMRVVEKMVGDSRWFVARNGVAVLGEIGGEAAISMLMGTLANEEAKVRRETVLSLAKIGGDDAGMLAMGMLSDGDAEVRATAARAMAVLKVERAIKPLMEMLENENDQVVVERVLRALGEIGDPSAVQAIEKKAVAGLLRKSPTDIRVAAYTALGAIGTPRAKSLVEAATKDKDAEVRAAAQAALRLLRAGS
jgi:HEAT repeats